MTTTTPSGSQRSRIAGLRATSQAALGTSRFGVGPGLAGAIIVVYGFLRFITDLASYSALHWNIVAWALFLITITLTLRAVRNAGFHLTTRAFAAASASFAVVAAIDVWSVWGRIGTNQLPTAACAIGGVLIAAVSLRPIREILICTGILGCALVALALSGAHERPPAVGAQLTMLMVTVAPPLIACLAMDAYRRLSRKALDRVMIQSTVSAPAFGPGFFVSARLTSLDRDVEKIFERVASGELPLPLPAGEAEHAAELATELRSYLTDDRQNTWLYHAIEESAVLRGNVTLDDPSAGAAYLQPVQRDGLLSALWLLVQTTDGPERRARLRIGVPYTVQRVAGPQRRFHVEIIVYELRRSRVEPAAWAALRSVGGVVDTQTPHGMRFALECDMAVQPE